MSPLIFESTFTYYRVEIMPPLLLVEMQDLNRVIHHELSVAFKSDQLHAVINVLVTWERLVESCRSPVNGYAC